MGFPSSRARPPLPAIAGGLRTFSLTQVWGGDAAASQNRPAPARAHVIREDGQLPALQHVLQFFVGCGPSGCGEEGLDAQGWASLRRGGGMGQGPGTPPFHGALGQASLNPEEGPGRRLGRPGSLQGRHTH